jgi:hypothetical protein
MLRFYLPAKEPDDWRRGLASPDKQWRPGYSAWALAHCWQTASELPSEVRRLFTESGVSDFAQFEPLIGLVEHQVPVPG